MFLQNRRCGGNTLSEIFMAYGYDVFKLGTFYDDVHTFGDFLSDCDVAARDFYLGHFCYGSGNKVPNGVKYFTNVRDPIQRLLSLYRAQGKGAPQIREWLLRHWETDNGMTKRWAGIGTHGNLVFDHDRNKVMGDIDSFKVTNDIFNTANKNISSQIEFFFIQDYLIESMVLFEEHFSFPPMFSLDGFSYNTSTTKFGRDLDASITDELKELNKFDYELYNSVLSRFETLYDSVSSELKDKVRIRKLLYDILKRLIPLFPVRSTSCR